MKLVQHLLALFVLLFACDSPQCMNWRGEVGDCGRIEGQSVDIAPASPIRYCVDQNGLVLDEIQCDSVTSPGVRWVFHRHYYYPGQTIVIHDTVPQSTGFVSRRDVISNPTLLRRYSNPSGSTATPPRAVAQTPRPAPASQPRVSSLPVRSMPAVQSPRISSVPVRTAPAPARMSAPSSPRVSTARVR